MFNRKLCALRYIPHASASSLVLYGHWYYYNAQVPQKYPLKAYTNCEQPVISGS
jgi:hypothetical protein